MSCVVFIAVSSELGLLLFYKMSIGFLKVVDLKIQPMNHGFEFSAVVLSCVYFRSGIIDLSRSYIELLIQRICSVHKNLSLFVKD